MLWFILKAGRHLKPSVATLRLVTECSHQNSAPVKSLAPPVTVAFLILALAGGCSNANRSPYAGQESQTVKSLSDTEIKNLPLGAGVGYAKLAELNGFPGPKHVLELADELDLSKKQRALTKNLFEDMQRRARTLGAELVDTEKALDRMFNADGVDSTAALIAMKRAAELEAQIRWTHVSAHLVQNDILSPEQRLAYVRLRGYDENPKQDGNRQHGEGHQHGT